MKRPIPVQFNLQDVKTLIHCKAQLDAVISALGASSWQGSRTAIAALGIVDQAVCDWFNRVEPHWLKYLNRGTAGAAAPSPSLPASSEVGGSPAASVQDQGEKA
jgi:hypothetical protein